MSRRVFYMGYSSTSVLPLLLDVYPNAIKAHSFQLLRLAYAGDAQRARVNVTEADIPFIGNVQDTAALLTLAGGSSAFMPIFYDQSTALSDSTQTSATSQPRTVNSGVLDSVNGYPVAVFDQSNDFLSCPDLIPQLDGTTPFTFTCVVRNQQTTQNGAIICWGRRTANQNFISISISNTTLFGGHRFFVSKRANNVSNEIVANLQLNTNDLYLLTADFDGTDYRLYVNGNLIITATDGRPFGQTVNFAEIGRRNSSTSPTQLLGSSIAELVLWPVSQFSAGNITGINSHIMNRYGIT